MLSPIAASPDTMSAVTSITGTRARATSLSLTLSLGLHSRNIKPTLETLPTEILYRIAVIAFSTPRPFHVSQGYRLGGSARSSSESSSDEGSDDEVATEQWALDRSTLCALALTSRTVSIVAHAVLYHTVQLNELRPLELFARTTRTTRKQHVPRPHLIDFNSGKETTRLVLDLPEFGASVGSFSRPTARDKRALEHQNRLYVAAASVLGFGSTSSPSVLFNNLRTLVVPCGLLLQAMKAAPMLVSEESFLPSPVELILDTYLDAPSTQSLAGSPAPHNSPLTLLGSSLTHLTISAPPKYWCLPSDTLAALGGTPALTHLAIIRRAHANGDNDTEFVRDVAQLLTQRSDTLTCIVVAISPDMTFRRLKAEQKQELGKELSAESAEREAELDPHSTVDPSIRALEAYLSQSDIWKSLSTLALEYPFTKRDYRPCLCIIPSSGDVWARATDKRSSGDGAYAKNIYLDTPKSRANAVNGDFWTWSRKYDEGRRAREAYKATLMT